jgi:CBS domain-containing protein
MPSLRRVAMLFSQVSSACIEEVDPMRVRDVMSKPPLTVPPEMSLRDLAALLTKHEISGVPVVENGRLVGVVSASDIVERERGPDVESRGRFPQFHRRARSGAASASTVGQAMKTPPITIEAWMSVYEAAWLMSSYDVNRLPVVDRDELVGVVTRSDLVRYFARSDHDIERDVIEKIALLESPRISVVAKHGRVLLQGELESATDLACLSHLVASVPGVTDVDSRVTVGSIGHPSQAPGA